MSACNRAEPAGDQWRVGGLYSTEDDKGQFSVVKILVLEPEIVHLRIYKQKFSSRPMTVDPGSLTVGMLGDAEFSIPHLPLSRKRFASWKPTFISQQSVQASELEGYRLWKTANGGVF